MQTNEEIYQIVKLIAQAKNNPSGLVFYVTKNEEGTYHIGQSIPLNFADEFTEKNIQEMNDVSSKDDFVFWIESKEGKAFFNAFLDDFMGKIKEKDGIL